jgi:hypothetical protein
MKLTPQQNSKYRNYAVRELESISINQVLEKYPAIDLSLLKTMFSLSSQVMRSNPADKILYMHAEHLFESCINISRCVLVDDPDASYLLCNGTTYCLEAYSQYNNAVRNFEIFTEYKNNC